LILLGQFDGGPTLGGAISCDGLIDARFLIFSAVIILVARDIDRLSGFGKAAHG
jgi:hypothetical protein